MGYRIALVYPAYGHLRIKNFLVQQRWILSRGHNILDDLYFLIYNIFNGGNGDMYVYMYMYVFYTEYV